MGGNVSQRLLGSSSENEPERGQELLPEEIDDGLRKYASNVRFDTDEWDGDKSFRVRDSLRVYGPKSFVVKRIPTKQIFSRIPKGDTCAFECQLKPDLWFWGIHESITTDDGTLE